MFLKYNTAHLILSIGAALSLHFLAFSWLVPTYGPHITPANIHSPAAQVSVRFVTMKKEAEVITPVEHRTSVQKVIPNPIKKTPPQKKLKKPAKIVKTPTPQKMKAQVKPLPKKVEAPIAQSVTKKPEMPQKKQVNTPIPIVSDASVKGYRTPPRYPIKAQRRKQQGVVLIHVLISETGKREGIKIHTPSKHTMLNQAALKAVKKWRFDPYIVNGKPVRSWVEIPIEFKIK